MSLKDAINRSETPTSSGQDVTTSHATSQKFMDPVAQHRKKSVAEQLHVRNTAINAGQTQHGDPTVPSYQHGDPEY